MFVKFGFDKTLVTSDHLICIIHLCQPGCWVYISVMSHLPGNFVAQLWRTTLLPVWRGQSYTLYSVRETSCATRRHATSLLRIWCKSQSCAIKSPGVTSHLVCLCAGFRRSWNMTLVSTAFVRAVKTRTLWAEHATVRSTCGIPRVCRLCPDVKVTVLHVCHVLSECADFLFYCNLLLFAPKFILNVLTALS